jgi:23S rRNA pseudouridine2605 synthase
VTDSTASVRLQKVLSQAGVASRRAAEKLIADGRVSVNGKTILTMGVKVDPQKDDVRVDGSRIKAAARLRYILLYKPTGFVTTRSDPQRRRTVIDLLAATGIRGYFYPVGRLDYDSEGLIILTNYGSFAERVTHPRYELERTYEAVVEGVPDDRDLERLRRGVPVDGERTHKARISLKRTMAGRKGEQSLLEVVIYEGRNRQVRKMCDAIAHPVARLRRVRIGTISDSRLRPGDFRDLTEPEVRALTAGSKEAPSDRKHSRRPDRSR